MSISTFYKSSTELFVRPAWQDGRTVISKLIAADATNYPAGFFPKGLIVCEVSSGVVDPYINLAYVTLSTCETVWTDGTNGTNILSTDTPSGVYSNKVTIAAAASAGDVVSYIDITSIDNSASAFLMFWCKSSIALDASDIKILTDDTSACASAVTLTGVPAMNANEWYYVIKAIGGTPNAATISVGIEADVDKGLMDFWIADVRGADVQTTAACGLLAEDVVFDPNLRAEYGDYNGTGNWQCRVATSGDVFVDKCLGYDSDALTDLGGVLSENDTVMKFST